MPVVPSPSVPSVAPTGTTGVPYQTAAGASPEAFGSEVGKAEQGLGKTIEGIGDVMAKHAMKMQEDLNVSHAEDLFLNGNIELGKLQEQYKSLEGTARVNALPKFMEDAAAIRAKYKEAAPNQDVDKKFDQLFTRQLGYAVREAGGLAGQATRQYMRDTSKAVQANSMSEIAKAAEDDGQFEYNTKTALQSMQSQPDYQGATPEVKQEMERSLTTGAWATRLQSMAKTDPLRARELFQKNKGSIDGITQLKLEDGINQQIVNVQSRVDADKIIQSGAFVSPELKERVKKFEGYVDDPKGISDYKQRSSGYGTKVEPGDENLTADQRKAVYEQRLDRDLGRAATIVDNFAPGLPSGTRNSLISLTYNAGSAWTSLGLGQSIRAGDMEGARSKFLEYKYAGGQVNKVLEGRRAQEATWFGGEARESDPVSQMGQALEKAKEQGIKTFPNDPANQAKYVDTLQNRIKADFNVLQGAARDMQLQTRNVVQAELFTPDHKVTSYDQLSPKAQQAYDQAPPMLQKSFNDAMKRNATADIPLTNAAQDRFDALRGEANNPNTVSKFVSRDLSNEELPRVMKSKLKALQDDKNKLTQNGVKMAPYMNSMRADLNDAKIGESKSDTTQNDNFNKFRGVYETAISKFEEEKKRPPNEQEGRDIGRGLLKDIVTSHNRILPDSHDRAYRVVADSAKSPIALRGDTDVERDKHFAELPSGATFVDPDGKKRVKR